MEPPMDETTIKGTEEEFFCPDDCQYLRPTEEDQKKYLPVNVDHYCYLHKRVVKHEGYHPKIVKVKGCKVEK
jgi:hypothetical protein